jgi:hypothetical protein
LGGEEAAVSANATPTINKPINKKNRSKIVFITFLLEDILFSMT